MGLLAIRLSHNRASEGSICPQVMNRGTAQLELAPGGARNNEMAGEKQAGYAGEARRMSRTLGAV